MVREESLLRDSNTSKEGGEKKPPPPPNKPSPKPEKPKIKRPAACHVYRTVYKRWPPKDVWDDLDKVIGQESDDLDKLKLVIQAWKMQGNKPHNFTGIIDWYRNGVPNYAQKGKTNGRQHQTTNGSRPGLNQDDRNMAAKIARLSTGASLGL